MHEQKPADPIIEIMLADVLGIPSRQVTLNHFYPTTRIAPTDRCPQGCKPIAVPDEWKPNIPIPCKSGWFKAETLYLQALVDNQSDYVWFIESDVYAHEIVWRRLFEYTRHMSHDLLVVAPKTRSSNPTWMWFKDAPAEFKTGILLPLSRVSKRALRWLVQAAESNRNIFCELAMPSTVENRGGTIYDLLHLGLYDSDSMSYYLQEFDYDDQRIFHPVKHEITSNRLVDACSIIHQKKAPKRVVSFSLWGDHERYAGRAPETIRQARHFYPDWEIRVYVSDDVADSTKSAMVDAGAVIHHAPRWCKKAGYFWRFLAASDTDVDAMICRDIDSDITAREFCAVEMWLRSGLPFHIIRDHPYHQSKIMAGLWGCRRGILHDMTEMLRKYKPTNHYGDDEEFLEKMVYSRVRPVAMIHSEMAMFPDETCLPIPHVRADDGDFIGKANNNSESIERQKSKIRAWQQAGSQPIRENQLRIAVLFYGTFDCSLDQTIHSIRSCLLEPLYSKGAVDIYYHTWDRSVALNSKEGEHDYQLGFTQIQKYFSNAQGGIDKEDDFASVIDWEHIYRNNPYKTGSLDDSAAQAAIRDVILALHSLEMAYDIMLDHGKSYDLVVATRANLQFLKPLILPQNLSLWEICLPGGDGQSDYDDRFACGGLEAMEIYCRRSEFFDGWMLHPNGKNSEWILAQWLKRNRMPVSVLDFPSQVMRSNGEIFSLGPRESEYLTRSSSQLHCSVVDVEPIAKIDHHANSNRIVSHRNVASVVRNQSENDQIRFPSWDFLKSRPVAIDFKQQFPLAFYINLESRDDRRVHAEFQFASQCMQVERIPAAIGKNVRNTRGHGNKNQYACRLSHRMAIRQAKIRKAPCVLIFEDDVILHPLFREIVARLTPPEDWGILFFGCTHVKPPDVIAPGWVKVNYLWGLQAYVVKAQWYDRLLSALNKVGSGARDIGADNILSELSKQIPMYATYPNIAWQSEGYSDLMNMERQPFTKDGQQNRLLHVIRDVNEEMRHKIACIYGDEGIDEKKHHFLQPKDVYTAVDAVWTLKETFPWRLCIIFEESIKRRERAKAQFSKADVDFAFFPAVDGRMKKNISDPTSYSRLMSHLLALRQAWQSGAEAVLIVEDDVVMHKNLKAWAEGCSLPDDWGILYFGSQHMLTPSVEGRGIVRIHGSLSAHAYGVRRSYIPQIMNAMRIGLKTCAPYDMVLMNLHQAIPTYGFYPNLAWRCEVFCEISGKSGRSFESDGVQIWPRNSIVSMDQTMKQLHSGQHHES